MKLRHLLNLLLTAMTATAVMACNTKNTTAGRDDDSGDDNRKENIATADIEFYLTAENTTSTRFINALAETYPQLREMLRPDNTGSYSPMIYATTENRATVDSLLQDAAAKGIIDSDIRAAWSITPDDLQQMYGLYLLQTPAVMAPQEPIRIEYLEAGRRDPYDRIDMRFGPDDTKTWATVTRNNISRQIAIMVDGQVASAPFVQSEITAGHAMITGSKIKELFDRISTD